MSLTRNPGRSAGLLYLFVSIPGAFALLYVPGKLIVEGNAAATVSNIAAHQTLFRLGIVVQLISQALFFFVALALYDLLKGVSRRHAGIMVALIGLAIPIAFVNELNSLAIARLVDGADLPAIFAAFGREPLVNFFLGLHDRGFDLAGIFWGLWLFPLGLLVYRSRFIPRVLGIWLIVAGVGYLVLSLTGILAPEYRDQVFIYTQPAVLGELAFMLWLIVRGARPPASPTDSLLSAGLEAVAPDIPQTV